MEKDYKKCDTGKEILRSLMLKEQDELENEMEAFFQISQCINGCISAAHS